MLLPGGGLWQWEFAMKAAVVTDFTQPLEIQDRPSRPRAGEVLVRIEASGPVPHRHPRRPR